VEPCRLAPKQTQPCCIGLRDDAAHGNGQCDPIFYNNHSIPSAWTSSKPTQQDTAIMSHLRNHTVYLVAINGGNVCEVDNSGKEIKTQKATQSKSQQWVLEHRDTHEFALRNVATDKYLGASKGDSGTHCMTGNKQFWRAESGHAPGSFW
jgi:hypothetical protein